MMLNENDGAGVESKIMKVKWWKLKYILTLNHPDQLALLNRGQSERRLVAPFIKQTS